VRPAARRSRGKHWSRLPALLQQPRRGFPCRSTGRCDPLFVEAEASTDRAFRRSYNSLGAADFSYGTGPYLLIDVSAPPCVNIGMHDHPEKVRQMKSPGHAALRRGRRSLDDQVYLITLVTRLRAPLFADFHLACAAAACITDPRLWRGGQLLAWVLMPDHWHGLVQLGRMDDLGSLAGRVKAVTASRINAHRGSSGPIWGRAFHDRALRGEDQMLPAARYIVANPMRAGLARSVGDYPFWGTVWLL